MAHNKLSLTLRALAHLLSYPDAALRSDLPALREVLLGEGALSAQRVAELERLIDKLASREQLDAEADYVQIFDRGRATSLHLFEHVHGDSRDRGPAMIDLGETYAKAGLMLAPGELPDYLPAVLEFASTQPRDEARAFLAEMAHIFNALASALSQRKSLYASIPTALLEMAGEKVQPMQVPEEEPLDESWAEPPVFAGCASPGQSKPDQPQPIHFVRKGTPTNGVSA